MRKNLHPGCSCGMCRRGKRASGCKPETARKLRRRATPILNGIAKGQVAADHDVQVVVSGGYTD